jgi:hypothetical protein
MMQKVLNFDSPTICIVHFKADEGAMRTVYYQVVINPECLSPAGDFMRFNTAGEEVSELHGWVPIEDIVIDEILETLELDEAANG